MERFLRRNIPKVYEIFEKIDEKSSPTPLKSSPEPSKMPFLKYVQLKKAPKRAEQTEKSILSPIPCAAHVPPRCRGETKSRSKCQSVGAAFLKALCDEMRGVAKSTAKEF